MPASDSPSGTALPALAGAGWTDASPAARQALAPCCVMDSSDLDQAREQIGRIYKPHELSVEGRRQSLQARMHHRALGASVGLSRLAHGAAVRIDPDRLEHFFLVQMPLAGGARIRHAQGWVDCGVGQASVLSASEPVRMHWSEPCDKLMLRIEQQRLLEVLQALQGGGRDDARAPLRLAPLVDLRSPAGRTWWQLMHYLAALLDPRAPALLPQQAAMLEEHVICALLTLAGPALASAPAPQPLVRARLRQLEDHILAHLAEPLTLTALAQQARTSVRTLQGWFAQAHGMTPTAYIRARRLEQVRHALQHPGPQAAVTEVAARWGFEHLGRFAAAYRARYGEAPSATLRRAQAPGLAPPPRSPGRP